MAGLEGILTPVSLHAVWRQHTGLVPLRLRQHGIGGTLGRNNALHFLDAGSYLRDEGSRIDRELIQSAAVLEDALQCVMCQADHVLQLCDRIRQIVPYTREVPTTDICSSPSEMPDSSMFSPAR